MIGFFFVALLIAHTPEAMNRHGGTSDRGAHGVPTPVSFAGLENREEVIAKPRTFSLAQHGALPQGPETPEQGCSRECHRQHCDEWSACYSAADPVKCQLEVNRTEADCIRRCETPKTMRSSLFLPFSVFVQPRTRSGADGGVR